jgi:hypothetical protein
MSAVASAKVAVLLELLHDPLEITLARGGVDRGRLQALVSEERGRTSR